MDVSSAIHERRAYRSLAPVEITQELIRDLAGHAQLAPSCFNNQPARFVFVWEPGILDQVKEALSPGNAWARAASMIIVVFAEKEKDCVIKALPSESDECAVGRLKAGAGPPAHREYYLFDTGLAVSMLMLRATELGLVAHPIAGFSPRKAREILGIPDSAQVITFVIVGRHAQDISPVLSENQVQNEKKRPGRLPLEQVAFFNRCVATGGESQEEV
jgi:nitroreductase